MNQRATAVVFGILSLTAAAAFADSGSMTMKYSKVEPIQIGDKEGHIIYLGESAGSNKGGTVDGAEVKLHDFVDITQGNGIHRGYVIFNKNGDMKLAKFDGKITTVMSADNQPLTSFAGTYTDVHGTGAYASRIGLTGKYTGSFTSQTDFVAEWNED